MNYRGAGAPTLLERISRSGCSGVSALIRTALWLEHKWGGGAFNWRAAEVVSARLVKP
jgi:hypothetical protein